MDDQKKIMVFNALANYLRSHFYLFFITITIYLAVPILLDILVFLIKIGIYSREYGGFLVRKMSTVKLLQCFSHFISSIKQMLMLDQWIISQSVAYKK